MQIKQQKIQKKQASTCVCEIIFVTLRPILILLWEKQL